MIGMDIQIGFFIGQAALAALDRPHADAVGTRRIVGMVHG